MPKYDVVESILGIQFSLIKFEIRFSDCVNRVISHSPKFPSGAYCISIIVECI